MDYLSLTLDQINYKLREGLILKEEADEYVKAWNNVKINTFVQLLPTKFKRGGGIQYGWQIQVFDIDSHKLV